MNNRDITKRAEDFAKWYTDIVRNAELATYSGVKGFTIIEPLGFAIWENIKNELDKEFKKTNHQNVYMPLLIPRSLLVKEKELIEGFAPEVAWVLKGGDKDLTEPLAIRPTSETLFSEYFREKIKSHRDLPMLLNQWCSVVRWEKETRPFLRGREFLWQEGHTLHETKEEAQEEALKMLRIYEKFLKDFLAIPCIVGMKTEKEKFSGAVYSLTLEALMYNGVSLQAGTSHFLGDNFSKSYDIKYSDQENNLKHPYGTSWGITTRLIGALIMVHSDDLGLVLPPKIAPVKVSIVEIKGKEEAIKLKNTLEEAGISVSLDDSDSSPGEKFANSEIRGFPIRLEVGKRDLEKDLITLVRRDTLEKIELKYSEFNPETIEEELDKMQRRMYEKALLRREENTYHAESLEDFERIFNNKPGFVYSAWCGSEECEDLLKEKLSVKSRCIPLEKRKISKTCAICGKPSKYEVIWGIQY